MQWIRAVIGFGLVLVASRGRLWGRWWKWRQETAFGSNPQAVPGSMRRHAMRDFFAWIYRQW